MILCSGAILPLGSHHSADKLENFATSAGSTVEAFALGFGCIAISDALLYFVVMALRNASGEAMARIVSLPSPTPLMVTSP